MRFASRLGRSRLIFMGALSLGLVLVLGVLRSSWAATAVPPLSATQNNTAALPAAIKVAHTPLADLPLATSRPATTTMRALLPITFAPPEPPPDEPTPFGPAHSGEATYYNATGAGNCAFPATPNDLMVAALNTADYNNAALCGAYAQVTGPNGSVIVRVVDRCPPCAAGDIDLSQQAFAQIADLVAGRVPVTWQLVSYPLPDPIIYHFKDGSNQWWTAVQIRNHRHPVTKVEYLDGSGNFQEIPRTDYNYFVAASGLGPGPYTFRVTDYFGQMLVDSDVPHIENGDVPGSAQFPPPGG